MACTLEEQRSARRARGRETPASGAVCHDIRVFLLDDQEIVRRGLRSLFEAEGDIDVVGEASTAKEAVVAVCRSHPDVALLDVRLPDGNGVEVCRDLRSEIPELRCLMLSAFDDDGALLSEILAGASGYLLKQLGANELVSAVRRVAAGESLFDPALIKNRLEKRPEDERMRWLTGQERKILMLIAHAKTNHEIATEMSLKEKTVKNYVSNLLSKMGFAHRTEAAVYAVRLAEREQQCASTPLCLCGDPQS